MDKSAIKVIEQYWNTAPVDVFSIIKDMGLVFERFPMEDNLSGYIQNTGSGYTIAVNSNHYLVRQRFTAAHELGHYIYHRHLIGDGVDDNRAYRSAEGGKFYNTLIGPRQETQANQFAANLLMPQHLIAALKKQGHRDPDLLAEMLAVSKPAIRIHLGYGYEAA